MEACLTAAFQLKCKENLRADFPAICHRHIAPPSRLSVIGWRRWLYNKKETVLRQSLSNRQLPILPGRLQPSTFGVYVLNYCVRNGNRWSHIAIITGLCCCIHLHVHTIAWCQPFISCLRHSFTGHHALMLLPAQASLSLTTCSYTETR